MIPYEYDNCVFNSIPNLFNLFCMLGFTNVELRGEDIVQCYNSTGYTIRSSRIGLASLSTTHKDVDTLYKVVSQKYPVIPCKSNAIIWLSNILNIDLVASNISFLYFNVNIQGNGFVIYQYNNQIYTFEKT